MMQSWFKHFKQLLGNDNPNRPDLNSTFFNQKVSDPLQIDTSKFTLEELQTCLAMMPKQKPSGSDNLPTILWKDLKFHSASLFSCNETLEGNKPSTFSKSSMIIILKRWFTTPFKLSWYYANINCIKDL